MIVKATSDEGTDWGGFPVVGATMGDADGNSFPAKAIATGSSPQGGEPAFYPQATTLLGDSGMTPELWRVSTGA
jgi:hypothetical protein